MGYINVIQFLQSVRLTQKRYEEAATKVRKRYKDQLAYQNAIDVDTLCTWSQTPEGVSYWADIQHMETREEDYDPLW